MVIVRGRSDSMTACHYYCVTGTYSAEGRPAPHFSAPSASVYSRLRHLPLGLFAFRPRQKSVYTSTGLSIRN